MRILRIYGTVLYKNTGSITKYLRIPFLCAVSDIRTLYKKDVLSIFTNMVNSFLKSEDLDINKFKLSLIAINKSSSHYIGYEYIYPNNYEKFEKFKVNPTKAQLTGDTAENEYTIFCIGEFKFLFSYSALFTRGDSYQMFSIKYEYKGNKHIFFEIEGIDGVFNIKYLPKKNINDFLFEIGLIDCKENLYIDKYQATIIVFIYCLEDIYSFGDNIYWCEFFNPLNKPSGHEDSPEFNMYHINLTSMLRCCEKLELF